MNEGARDDTLRETARDDELLLPRRQGRGRRQLQGALSADAVEQATRRDILAAATEEFVRHGYQAASISGIAERMRSSKRMLYYHFRSKEQLYIAVLEAAWASVRRVGPPPGSPVQSPMQRLEDYAQEAFDRFLGNQDFVRLVLYENLSGAQVLRSASAVSSLSADNLKSLEEIVRDGRADGSMRDDFRVLDLFLTIVALCFHPVSNRESILATMGVDLLAAAEVAHRRRLVAEVARRFAARAPG